MHEDLLDHFEESIKKIAAISLPTAQDAFEAGKDCAINGANTTNCHFRFFGNRRLLEEWERGRDSVKRNKISVVPDDS